MEEEEEYGHGERFLVVDEWQRYQQEFLFLPPVEHEFFPRFFLEDVTTVEGDRGASCIQMVGNVSNGEAVEFNRITYEDSVAGDSDPIDDSEVSVSYSEYASSSSDEGENMTLGIAKIPETVSQSEIVTTDTNNAEYLTENNNGIPTEPEAIIPLWSQQKEVIDYVKTMQVNTTVPVQIDGTNIFHYVTKLKNITFCVSP